MVDVTELTFGIEIETIATQTSVAAGLVVGGYRHGIQVPYLPAGWTAQSDGSIRPSGSGALGCEIVSPILRGAEGLAQVREVMRILVAKGHLVNESCGIHVHVGWRPDWSAKALARLITITSYAEAGIYAITGTKHRERGSYCHGIKRYGSQAAAKRQMDANRYHILNLRNLATGAKNTVEFRAFSGTLNEIKAIGWIQVCLGLVERALNGNRMPSWAPKPLTGGWAKAGPGQSEAERLMGYLAWGEGYARIHNGKQYGWMLDAETQKVVKKEFRRLAKKYDAET
ncbi:MAG: amidoligase family protein [Opitutaceae bacterium]|jgi:hypothetical protein